MINSPFIRPLSLKYNDITAKEVIETDIPFKFRQRQIDDWTKRIKIESQQEPKEQSTKTEKEKEPVEQESCCNFIKNIFVKQKKLCESCKSNLCSECRRKFSLNHSYNVNNIKLCNNCEQILCEDCRKMLDLPPFPQLRNYIIKIKHCDQMHFKDCKCIKCKIK